MKKTVCIVVSVLCMFLTLTGCGAHRQVSVREAEGTKIYFIRKDEDGRKYFDYEKCEIKRPDVEDRVEQILSALKAPKSKGAYLEVPEFIELTSVRLSGNVLHLDFSRSYRYLEPEPKLIVATLVCMSVLDDGIAEYIKITCEGEEQPPVYDGYIHAGILLVEDKMYMQ